MIELHGPYENTTTVTILPNPEFDNARSLTSSVDVKRAMDGTRYTYVKAKVHEKLEFTFQLTPSKSEELKAFIEEYIGQAIRVVDHDGKVWRVNLTNDEFSYQPRMRDNWVEVSLELKGVLVNG